MRPQDFSLMKVSLIMRRQARTVIQDASVLDAAKEMSAFSISAIAVTDKEGNAAGIFTESGLMNKVVVQGKDPAATPVSAAMTAVSKTAAPDTLISEALTFMQNERACHLVVVDAGAPAGIISLWDINRLLLEAVEDVSAQIKKAIRQLLDAEQMSVLGEFTGSLTHELNQPLNVTKIICQSLLRDIQKDRFSPQDAQNDLPEIVTQMNRMSEMVAHMSALSRPNSAALPQPQDINSLIENTLKFIRQQYKDHRVALEESLASGLAPAVVNNTRIEQAFFNILSNAYYAVINSGKAEKKIRVQTYSACAGKEVVVEVSDNGNGISEEHKSSIFQPLFTTKEPKGTGMGLLFCKKVIEEYNGRVEFESNPGEGASFRIILPAKGM